jgi:hypothetical protein
MQSEDKESQAEEKKNVEGNGKATTRRNSYLLFRPQRRAVAEVRNAEYNQYKAAFEM